MLRHGFLPLAFALTSGACFNQAPSIHPLFVDTVTVPVDGRWHTEEGPWHPDRDLMTFERRDDHYELDYRSQECKQDDCSVRFDVRFGRLSGRLFADFTLHDGVPNDGKNQIGSWPVHAFARVELTKDRLEFSVLDRDWLRGAMEHRLLSLKHENADGDVFLTASTRDLQRVLTEWANHPDAFGSTTTFSR